MPICIYCLKDKSLSEFNKEHVIPQSFGHFTNNFTLLETVCKECNQYFGDELELYLARDTFEGMLRFKRGVKAPKDFKSFNNRRVLFRLNEEGTWKGAIMRLKYAEDQKKMVVDPVNQVGFQKKDTGEWVFFEIEDIKSKDDLEKQGFVVGRERALKILFLDFKEKNEIEQELREKGIKLDGEESLSFDYSGETVSTGIRGTIDKIIFRGIAKIAFNYLAFIEGRNFALDDNFTDIRNFIRYGESNNFRHVIIRKEPILENEKRFGIQETQGHLITLGWNGNKTTLVSQVTLFNMIFYRVIFCKRFWGIYRNIASGHHFDIEFRKISKLGSLPKNFLIP